MLNELDAKLNLLSEEMIWAKIECLHLLEDNWSRMLCLHDFG